MAVASSIAGGLLTSTTAAAAPSNCPKVYVLAIPGTWANGPGLVGTVTRNLGPETQVRYVGYNATAFPWENGGSIYGHSKAQAVANTWGLAKAMVRRCAGTKIALTGYSQGADAAGDVASEIGTGRAAIRPSQFAGAVLISDPRRSRRDALVGPPLTGQGSGGPRLGGFGWVSGKTFSICHPKDLYCNVDRDYYITRIIGYLAETSNPTPSQFADYQAEAGAIFRDLMTRGGPGAIPRELSNARATEQIIKFGRFLLSGAHGEYSTLQVTPGTNALAWSQNFLAKLG
ncbi:cutinase family protein [Gordonia sp. CPCC 205333]|uniref:cutinase family protein n=1 Tax=Gordonia sp. CPCC 205333 TaxID=3140790 RepID=UPI003AF3CC67